jgi:hypothetical protein
MFTPEPGTVLEPADWEQGPSSREELSKIDPAFGTPFRPLAGPGLGIGRTAPAIAPDVLAAIGEVTEAPIAEASVTAEAAAPVTTPTEVPAGAVRGDGSATCPPDYPIKGNAQSMIYHTAASHSYGQTIAEFCFSTPEAAESAGYRAAKDL